MCQTVLNRVASKYFILLSLQSYIYLSIFHPLIKHYQDIFQTHQVAKKHNLPYTTETIRFLCTKCILKEKPNVISCPRFSCCSQNFKIPRCELSFFLRLQRLSKQQLTNSVDKYFQFVCPIYMQ